MARVEGRRPGVLSRVVTALRGEPERDSLQTRGVQLWPPVITEPRYLSQRIFDGSSAAGIPAVAKAMTLYGMLGALDLQVWRGPRRLVTPRFVANPDPDEPGSTWFVQQQVLDWFLNGNAVHLITARDASGFPAAVRWFPAHMWTVTQGPLGEDRTYYLNGRFVPSRDVVHVKRWHDPGAWRARGIGIVQQHLRTLNRAGMEEDAESGALEGGGVPSVAIIAPQKDLSQDEADAAGASWDEQFSGPARRPAILPNGTQVIPLGWSASDSEMVEARKMTLVDVANLAGFDGYWLGAASSSHTYKSPGPMFVALLRTAFEPVLSLFEDAWSKAWLPYGQTLRFDRDELTRDDLQTTVSTMVQATGSRPLLTVPEAREYMGRDPETGPVESVPVETPPADQQEVEG